MNTLATIARPVYTVTSLANALRIDWRGHHLSQKMDGCWQVCQFNGSIITGEIMSSGMFYAFDILTTYGQDVRQLPWTARRAALLDAATHFPAGMAIAPEGQGCEFIEAVLARGGEGIVAKPWQAGFGSGWQKMKRVETFDCLVTERDVGRGSVRLALDGEDCGWCPARSAFWQIKIGDIAEVLAFRRNASGKLREAKLIGIRADKMKCN